MILIKSILENTMKQSLLRLIVTILFMFTSQTLLAEKPSWAGKGKPSAEQKEAHKKAMNSKEDDNDDKEKKSKKEKSKNHEDDDDDNDDKEKKSKDMKNKSLNDMKEIEKGIEQKEEKRKKWWNFFN